MNNQNFDPFKQEDPQANASGNTYFAPEGNTAPQQTPAPQKTPAPQQGGYYFQPPAPQKQPTPGMAIASLVMGILSILCCSGLLSYIFGPLGIIFALTAPKNEQGERHSLSRTGLICSIVGLVLSVVYFVFLVVGIMTGYFELDTNYYYY